MIVCPRIGQTTALVVYSIASIASEEKRLPCFVTNEPPAPPR